MSAASSELDQSEHWQNLQAVIDPENTILKSALEEIKEIRTAEIKEEEEENEAERKEEIKELEKAIDKPVKAGPPWSQRPTRGEMMYLNRLSTGSSESWAGSKAGMVRRASSVP